MSGEDFAPSVNGFSKKALENFTWSNLMKYPTAFITVVVITFAFLLIMVCIPRANDKPMIAQLRPWTVVNSKTYYQYNVLNEVLVSETLSTFSKYFEFCFISLKNSHPIAAIFLRSSGTNFSGPQRAFCVLSSILTAAATNAMYYGKADVEVDDVQADALITTIYASLSSAFIPMFLEYLFSQHTPSLALIQRSNAYDIFMDKLVRKFSKIKQIRKLIRKYDLRKEQYKHNQMRFDVLQLLMNQDIDNLGAKSKTSRESLAKTKSLKIKKKFKVDMSKIESEIASLEQADVSARTSRANSRANSFGAGGVGGASGASSPGPTSSDDSGVNNNNNPSPINTDNYVAPSPVVVAATTTIRSIIGLSVSGTDNESDEPVSRNSRASSQGSTTGALTQKPSLHSSIKNLTEFLDTYSIGYESTDGEREASSVSSRDRDSDGLVPNLKRKSSKGKSKNKTKTKTKRLKKPATPLSVKRSGSNSRRSAGGGHKNRKSHKAIHTGINDRPMDDDGYLRELPTIQSQKALTLKTLRFGSSGNEIQYESGGGTSDNVDSLKLNAKSSGARSNEIIYDSTDDGGSGNKKNQKNNGSGNELNLVSVNSIGLKSNSGNDNNDDEKGNSMTNGMSLTSGISSISSMPSVTSFGFTLNTMADAILSQERAKLALSVHESTMIEKPDGTRRQLTTDENAVFTLIQAHLLSNTFWFGHWVAYLAWILGTLWILFMSTACSYYGINFDLFSSAKMDEDLANSVISQYNCSTTFQAYDVQLSDKINYNLTTEWIKTNVTSLDRGDFGGVPDTESYYLNFFISLVVSWFIWTPASAFILGLPKFILYFTIWKPKSDNYYTSYSPDVVNNEFDNESDLWDAILVEFDEQAICKYAHWVVQHPYFLKLLENRVKNITVLKGDLGDKTMQILDRMNHQRELDMKTIQQNEKNKSVKDKDVEGVADTTTTMYLEHSDDSDYNSKWYYEE